VWLCMNKICKYAKYATIHFNYTLVSRTTIKQISILLNYIVFKNMQSFRSPYNPSFIMNISFERNTKAYLKSYK